MELADLDALGGMPDAVLLALRDRLRAAGLDERFLARVARAGERLDDPLRAPMRAWNARRLAEPAAIAARLFVLHDPVPPERASEVLGDLGPLIEARLVERGPEGLASRAHLALAAGGYVFGDRDAAGDGVPPMNGVTAALAAAGLPRRPVDAALDLGCGAGALAIALSAVARRVVATDVNPRAVAWTRFNARLHAAEVDARLGDLYEPVRGERFDVIVSQPPFVAKRDGAEPSAFAHGGARGDELALRVVAGAAGHLAPKGRAVLLADWPLFVDAAASPKGEAPLEARIREAARPGADALVLQSPAKNLDEYCTSIAVAEHPRLDAGFARAAWAQRDHFERLGAKGVAQALVVLEPGAGLTLALAVKHGHDAPIGGELLDRLAARAALVRGADAELLAARLRIPAGTRLVEQPAVQGAPPAVIVQLAPSAPEWPFALALDAAAALRAIDGAPSVMDAARGTAQREGQPLEATAARFALLARDALRRGALEPG